MLRGLHDTRVPMIFAALGYWGIGLPLGVVLGFPLGLEGVGIWIGLASGLARRRRADDGALDDARAARADRGGKVGGAVSRPRPSRM